MQDSINFPKAAHLAESLQFSYETVTPASARVLAVSCFMLSESIPNSGDVTRSHFIRRSWFWLFVAEANR